MNTLSIILFIVAAICFAPLVAILAVIVWGIILDLFNSFMDAMSGMGFFWFCIIFGPIFGITALSLAFYFMEYTSPLRF